MKMIVDLALPASFHSQPASQLFMNCNFDYFYINFGCVLFFFAARGEHNSVSPDVDK